MIILFKKKKIFININIYKDKNSKLNNFNITLYNKYFKLLFFLFLLFIINFSSVFPKYQFILKTIVLHQCLLKIKYSLDFIF